MGRSVRWLSVTALSGLILILAGCGSKSTNNTTFPVPANIALSPSADVSLEVGLTQAFTATPQNAAKVTISTPVTFVSSNPAVVTIGANGSACAGSWNSLSNPTICTPGPSGVAQITATAQGVSSPPTTVYVHQHVDRITVTPVTTPTDPCISKDLTFNYQATAFSHNTNITSTVGTFGWQALNTSVVSLSTTATGLQPGQVQATANAPGITSIAATLNNVTSLPLNFVTCPVNSIELSLQSTGTTSFTAAASASEVINSTVIDTLGNVITNVPLTWSSSNPAVITASTGSARATSQPGGASVIASCTPPTCNAGFLPTLPIYPEHVISGTVTPSTTSPSTTVWVTTTGCGDTGHCATKVAPITTPANNTSPGNTVGTFGTLPATPNSFVFSRDGTTAYLGTQSSLQSTRGLMVLNVSANPVNVAQFTSTPGKVLAVSPDGKKVIVSDTVDTPNQVFIFDTASHTNTSTFQISGATAADFSPDSLKAYIIAGSTLYIYSPLEALKTVALAAPANDVSFLANGAFAYIAGGSPAGVTVRTNCANVQAATVNTPDPPDFIRSTIDGEHVVGVDSPGLDIIDVTSAPVGCSPAVNNTSVTSYNLGQGSFVPTQLIMATDGSAAYLLTSNLPNVLVFNIASRTSSAIQLSGNASPIRAALSPDGKTLYVTGSDGLVHVLDMVGGSEVQQVSFSEPFCDNVSFTCTPDLIAVKP